jgi:hypothetical protein
MNVLFVRYSLSRRSLILTMAAALFGTAVAQGQALRRADHSWHEYPPSVKLIGDNLDLATDAVVELIIRSRVPLPGKLDRSVLALITDSLVRDSSVDAINPDSSKLLMFNALADVFSLAEFEAGKLKAIGFASGANVASALQMSEEENSVMTLVTRRPDELALLKTMLATRDVSGIFKKQYIDGEERRVLANNVIRYAKRIGDARGDPCTDFARRVFFQQRDNFLPDAQISRDMKDSYRFFMHLNAEDGIIYVFGDTLVNRARTFLMMRNTSTQCRTDSQVTVYFVD